MSTNYKKQLDTARDRAERAVACGLVSRAVIDAIFKQAGDELEDVITDELKWRRAKAGRAFGQDTLVIPDGDPDPRLVKCAVYDCKYIHVADLLKLPVEDNDIEARQQEPGTTQSSGKE